MRKIGALALVCLLSACSSGPEVKSEAYAKLKNHRTFENTMPVVWKGVESAFRDVKITDVDPKEVNDLELRKLTHRTLKTDWVYGRSRDKYQEYEVNGTPRKTWLQERTRYTVDAHTVMGGVEVLVRTEEEVETLNPDGTSAGYHEVESPDSTRADDILNKINLSILSAGPSGAAPY